MQCKFADFIIDADYDEKRVVKYITETIDTFDYKIIVKNKDIEDERKVAKSFYTDIDLKDAVILRKFAEWLPNNNAFILHAVAIDVEGVGIAFAARSGTGKTTHLRLWKKMLKEKMFVVNGDKPVIRFFDTPQPFAYGTPWCGKEQYGCNMRTPLKHICFIERSATNSVEPMQKNDVVDLIFNQVYMPKDPIAAMNTMQLIDRLLSCCKLWKIKCNMDPEAAQIAYNAIIKGGKEK